MVLPQALKEVKFTETEYQQRYPDLKIGSDLKVDENGFIIAEPAAARKFPLNITLIRFHCNQFNCQKERLHKIHI
jgi:hypothetical protein